MNAIDDTGLAQMACGLAIHLAAGAALLLAGQTCNSTPLRSCPPGAADQVQPDRRIKRLGQMYEELEKLLAEHRTAVSTLKDIEKTRNEATVCPIQDATRTTSRRSCWRSNS